MGKALTQEEVVDRFVELHGRRYNYSSVNYINNRTELEIICEKHGTTFFMTSRTHLKGGKCDQCALEDREERFINKAKNVHGNEYNYSSVRYVESKIKVDVICEKHGTFSVIPKNHLQGVGCDSCSLEASAKKRTYTTE
ncbi:hypothetical protein KAR91_14125, partial [Candidatus Pacearchaeota archaeon]|nr:hypothetical protein [Candidatus Pacearchaeota archaeon]